MVTQAESKAIFTWIELTKLAKEQDITIELKQEQHGKGHVIWCTSNDSAPDFIAESMREVRVYLSGRSSTYTEKKISVERSDPPQTRNREPKEPQEPFKLETNTTPDEAIKKF